LFFQFDDFRRQLFVFVVQTMFNDLHLPFDLFPENRTS
jgi:hypothetical protein